MRRSKVARQEARRGKTASLRQRAKKEEKPAEARFTVVRTDDARQGKYLWCAYEGTTLDHAERLAAPVPGQEQSYNVVPVEVHEFARTLGEPVSAAEALRRYEEAGSDGL